MKKTIHFLVISLFLPVIAFSQTQIDLKLPDNKKGDRLATAHGMIAFGVILSSVSAAALSKADHLSGPQMGLYSVGLASVATGVTIYSFSGRGERRRK